MESPETSSFFFEQEVLGETALKNFIDFPVRSYIFKGQGRQKRKQKQKMESEEGRKRWDEIMKREKKRKKGRKR